MNLPFLKRFNKKVVPSYFLALVLRDEKAEAIVFEETEGRVKIAGQKEEHFSASIDDVSQEELLEKLDKAISSAEFSLPENIQTQKTIFGVKESWTDNDQIKKEHLVKLKKVSEELGLIPIGFLVISQAIAHLLQKEEGAPVSAILTEVNKKSVTVTLLRAGKSMGTKSSDIHDSIPFTVDTLLKHFDVPEILPSRIIIFNGKEDLSQEFISHAWSKSLPFLHLPQIANLPYGFDAKAVLSGAAAQMGFEVSEEDISVITKTKNETQMRNFNVPEGLGDLETSSEENPIEKPILHKNPAMSNFGFVKNKDIAKIPARQISDETEESQPNHNVPETQVIEKPVRFEKDKKNSQLNADDLSTEAKQLEKSTNVLTAIFRAIPEAVRKIDLKKVFSVFPSGKFVISISMILIAVIGLISSYFLLIKATVEIVVDPKISEQNKNVLFSTTGETDPNKSIIKGAFVNTSEDGSVSTAATGKKDVGTNAKGSVTIFNSLSESKTLTATTVLKASNGLEFTLDSSVTINAVASHSADETVSPQKVTVNVTANQLGKESNLPSGTKFSVGSFDTADLIAKNDNPFSGGTKKEVTVVSKNDSIKLEGDLVKQLEGKAKEDIEKQLGPDKILLPAFVTETLSKKSLNVKVGDEASQVTLTGTVEYQGISYSKNALIAFSKSLLSENVPSNQEIDYSQIKAAVLDMEIKNDEEIQANLDIKALLLPKIDQEKLLKEIKGKPFKNAEDILYKLPQVTNVNIKLSPNLPFLPKNLPGREKNIKFSTKING